MFTPTFKLNDPPTVPFVYGRYTALLTLTAMLAVGSASVSIVILLTALTTLAL
ncbi:hypothetical protein D3C71_2089460 [compost metagenome]